MPTPEYHAKLSPSSAARWINCPASIRLSEGIPDTTSDDAERGRLAHAIAELKARKKFLTPMSARTFNSQLKKLQENSHFEKSIDDYTDRYVEELTAHAMSFKTPPFIALETQVPVGLFTGEYRADDTPAFGTADCIQIGEGVLWITDYKNGAGVPVEAEENPQMMLYALGALAYYRPFYGDTIHTVRTTIVQPAASGVSTWETTRNALEDWGRDVVAPAAAKALSSEEEPHAGEWCRSHFCPLRTTCRARAQEMFKLEEDYRLGIPEGSLPEGWAETIKTNGSGPFGSETKYLLSDTEVGDALTRGADLVAWYNELKDYALQVCLDGKDIPGYKAVAGRSARDWDDLDTAFADLQQRGINEAMLYERKPVTPPGLEKALGKKPFAEVAADHVVQTPGKPTLVPASDKRPPYNAAEAAFGKERNNDGNNDGT